MARFTLIALAALTALPSTLAAPATPTCTTVTHTANYDDLPTGPLNPSHNYKGLTYEGFEIVAAKNTPFKPWTRPNLLKMTSHTGVIRAAEPGTKFNDLDTTFKAGAHNFRYGCANHKAAHDCQFTKIYGVPCRSYGCQYPDDHFELEFDASEHPHMLQTGVGAEGQDTPNITWTLYEATPRRVHLFLDQYVYFVTDCE